MKSFEQLRHEAREIRRLLPETFRNDPHYIAIQQSLADLRSQQQALVDGGHHCHNNGDCENCSHCNNHNHDGAI